MGNKIKKFFKKFQIQRTSVLILLFFFMSFTLVRELFNLQIIQGDDYINKFETRTTKTRVIKSTRGNIYDRNGVVLASNVLSYTVTFEDNGSYNTTREKNLTLNGIAYKVLNILSSNGDTLSHSFHVVVGEDGNYEFDVEEGFTLNRFKADIYGHALIDDLTYSERNATAEDMITHLSGGESGGFSIVLYGDNAYTEEELSEHGLPNELTKQEVLDITIIRYLLSTNSFKKYMPVTIATNVSEKSVAALKENANLLQGIDIVEDSVREYIDSESMGPVLGYTGRASSEELKELREDNPNYSNDAVIGKAGIEQYMELYLQGTDGEETVTVDNLGKVLKIDEDSVVSPVAGNDLYLTIDSDWQEAIYEILKQRVAGIVLSKIQNVKEYDYEGIAQASQIIIPIYDVYNALVGNSVIDINKFNDEDASATEQSLYSRFQSKQSQVFDLITDRLTGSSPAAYAEESEELQEYFDYILNDLLRDTLGIISKSAVDSSDATYIAYFTDGSISTKDYLTYAAGQNWIDISKINSEEEYLDSSEVYTSLTDYIVEYLSTDTGFSKLLYKFMLMDDEISGQELCLVLYEQGVLSKEDDSYESLASGSLSAYDFMIRKLWNLEIEPADLALNPCSASAVITDVNTGEVIACVSYPGYDNNRLSNNMDTAYYSKLAMDQSSPFFNKATQQQTAPGSTMKLLSAIAGLTEGIITEATYITCSGAFDLVDPPINCWNTYGHGSLEIVEAIKESCNYFFNMVGFELGRDSEGNFSESRSLSFLQKYASEIGLDLKTGIELTEATPKISDSLAVPSYMGQGTYLFTTTELARYAATIANKGTVYNLSLLDRLTDPEGNVIEDYEPDVEAVSAISGNIWNDLHAGMRQVVENHVQFDNLGMDISGKTGTAEVDIYHPNHGLFIGFAPSENPQYSIAVRIANGYSSGNACLAAADIVKYIFELDDRDNIITGIAAADTSETSND